MGMLTFSVLKKIKIKCFLHKFHRTFSTEVGSQTQIITERITGDPNYIDFLPSWGPEQEAGLRSEVLRHMRVLPGFVNEEEEKALLADVEPQLRRMRYEYDHWDNAIQGYRETERDSWSAASEEVVSRVRRVFPAAAALLPRVHVLDLAAAGHIKPHVDAVRFCGDMIAGLCLLSSAVMRLTHTKIPHLEVDAFLERRALYIMSGVARYEFYHAVLGGENSTFRGSRVTRGRRIAVICREQPPPTSTP